jgi:hypothetical protein
MLMRILSPYRISVKTHVAGLAAALLVTALVVFGGLHRSIIAESAVAAAIVGGLLWIYLAILLYLGVRPDNGYVRWSRSVKELSQNVDLPTFDDVSLPSALDLGGDDLVSIVLGILVAVFIGALAVLAAALLVWVGLNLTAILLIVVFIPIYYVFRRSLRLVLVHSRRCRRNLPRSVGIACAYATGYALFFCAVVSGMDWVVRAIAR